MKFTLVQTVSLSFFSGVGVNMNIYCVHSVYILQTVNLCNLNYRSETTTGVKQKTYK
jgi:hypothetical protein